MSRHMTLNSAEQTNKLGKLIPCTLIFVKNNYTDQIDSWIYVPFMQKKALFILHNNKQY